MMNTFIRKALLCASLSVAVIIPAQAQNSSEAIWARAEATPVEGGLVYLFWYLDGDEIPEDYVSEFKRAVNIGSSTAFILAEPSVGWQLAGFARDNGNRMYDNGVDAQIYVRPDNFFTAVRYPEEYYGDGSSSSSAQIEAEIALEDKEQPSDLIYAVFTQGDIARQAEDEEWMGKVWCSKLNNEAGDEVLFSANGETISPDTGGVRYYKFDHWETPDGQDIYDRTIRVTVLGGETYYAHFAQTTKDDYMENERKNPDLTAVRAVQGDGTRKSAQTYDLQGRRVEAQQKGVYIRNGKKVVMK
ncbi:MAG: hypothetical protein IJ767_08270 [Bacteroidaceae bacterium]|nr:hypothetical protein [Bacteroidaceae bacterium]